MELFPLFPLKFGQEKFVKDSELQSVQHSVDVLSKTYLWKAEYVYQCMECGHLTSQDQETCCCGGNWIQIL